MNNEIKKANFLKNFLNFFAKFVTGACESATKINYIKETIIMSRKKYASRLTKDELIKGGISLVTEDGYVFRGEEQLRPSISAGGYFAFPLYELDENGNKIKNPITRQFKGCKKPTDTYTYKLRSIGLHRLMWAWFHGEVPEGYVVDHISNKHETQEDYHLSNLQLLTPSENLAKERNSWHIKELKCKLNKPRGFYEDKLAKYEALYEEAKTNHNAKEVHKLRSNIANTRARLRYYDNHIDEVNEIKESIKMTLEEKIEKQADKKDLQILQEWKKVFREAGNKGMWHQCCKVEKLWKEGKLDKLAKNHCIDVLLGLRKEK